MNTSERNQIRAVLRVEGFVNQFDEIYRDLACHAAFFSVLTPELMYQVWANFTPEVPWVAVAQFLLSRLCRQVGYEVYQMDKCDRILLLADLENRFGYERLQQMQEFLGKYLRVIEDEDLQISLAQDELNPASIIN